MLLTASVERDESWQANTNLLAADLTISVAFLAFTADSLGPSKLSTRHDGHTFTTDPGVICHADAHLLADVILTLDLGLFKLRTSDQGFALFIDQRRFGLANASLLAVLMVVVLPASHLKGLVHWAEFALDTLATQESVVRATDAHLSTFRGKTAVGVASKAFRALCLWHCVSPTCHDKLALAVDRRVALRARTHLLAHPIGTFLLYHCVGLAQLDWHADPVQSCEAGLADTSLGASKGTTNGAKGTTCA